MVKVYDLQLAFDFVNSGAPMEHQAFLRKDTGRFYYRSEYGDNEEELPGDLDCDEYAEIPHKNDLNLGAQLALRFAAEFLTDDDECDRVRRIFRSRGAYTRFKDLLEYNGKLQQWYQFEAKAQNEALRRWCRVEGIEVDV